MLSKEQKDRLLTLPQHLIPAHLVSRLVGRLAASSWSGISQPLIRWFIRTYQVEMSEAANSDPLSYPTFNAFFTRPLREGARPIADARLVCPADGAISQLGAIDRQRIFQAKGHHYDLTRLVGGDPDVAAPFVNGRFVTVYLSPRDYHRVHMPVAGTLTKTIYVPGRLFSVNQRTAENVPNLFARNERLVTLWETELGPMALILVGAVIVAGIETVWSGQVAPPGSRPQVTRFGPAAQVELGKGEEMGRFLLGSTAIVLLGPEAPELERSLMPGQSVRLGQAMIR